MIKTAYQQTGRQAVILVDEYDKPLLQTMGADALLNEKYRNMLKAFYSVIKTCDQYIRFAFLTGVTKFSKVSIFSDLNNLRDISLEEEYAGICGITQKELEANFHSEIQALAQKQQFDYRQAVAALKRWYDGYLFHPAGQNMYNPFSVLNAFVKKEIKSYWFATGTPTFLVNFLKEARLYRLGFPNDEVRYSFLDNLLPAYSSLRPDETGQSVWRFIQDIRTGNVEGFMERMQWIIAGIPYDNFSEKSLKLREQNYQTAVYLIFALMGQFVQTEVHCYCRTAMDGGGSMQQRCFGSDETRSQNYTRMYSFGVDCVVVTADTIYLFEFKLAGTGTTTVADHYKKFTVTPKGIQNWKVVPKKIDNVYVGVLKEE